MKIKILAVLSFTILLAGNAVYAQSSKTDKKLYQHVLLFKWKVDANPGIGGQAIGTYLLGKPYAVGENRPI